MSKVLVAYASKHGSTTEIAEAVAGEIAAAGHDVDCVEAKSAGTVDDYDAIVIGSAVYIKRWQGDAKHFLRKHSKELASRPFWVFSSGPTGDPADDDPEWLEPPRIMRKAEELGVRDHVVFGGRIPPEGGGIAAKGMRANVPAEFQDRRDWDEIHAWARGIAAELG